jgi:hypothetical protein
MASRITRIDWTVLLKMISLNDSRSSREYPPSWISFICFRIVDFPDSPAPTETLATGPATAVPVDSHILTEKKHLNLIPLHHLISLQLILDLLVPGLALLLLCAHTATHLAGFLCIRLRDRELGRLWRR